MTRMIEFPSTTFVGGDSPLGIRGAERDEAATAAFVYDREFPAEWLRRLRQISEVSDEVGWLYPHWEAGDPWVPGQRWVLYEMIHEKFVDDAIVEELNGPHPRSEGHMCADKVPHQFQCLCRRKLNGWRDGPCMLVDLTQWQLYRKTGGYFAKRFWIIQGSTGGHKWEFNENERRMLRFADLPTDAPRLGSLPYAPFDERVVKQIMRHNKLVTMGISIEQHRERMGAGYEQYKESVAREARRQYVEYLSEQLQDVNDLAISAARKGDLDGHRKTEVDWERVEEASTDHFIETGHQLHPSMVK
jgi:hypothetical protein